MSASPPPAAARASHPPAPVAAAEDAPNTAPGNEAHVLAAPKTRTAVVFSVIALVLIGLNLRAGITGASALLHDLQLVLGYGPLVAAIIPSIPTLCFALAGAATSWLTGKLGVEKAILLSLALLAGGLLLRGIPATGMLWPEPWWACPGWLFATLPCRPSSANTSPPALR